MLRFLPISVVLALSIILWLWWRQSESPPLVVSGFIEAQEVRVGSRVGGRVVEAPVSDGQRVEQGEVIFKIDPFDLRDKLARAEAELSEAQAELDRLQAGHRPAEIAQVRGRRDRAAAMLEKLVTGPRPQEIEIARQERNIAAANLKFAESEHDRIQRLREERQAAAKELDEAVRNLAAAQAASAVAGQRVALLEAGTRREEIAEAQAALDEAEQALKFLEEGARSEDIAKAQARVHAAEADLNVLKAQVAELTVVSPCDCVVEAIDLQPGELVGQNAPAVALLDLSTMWVRTYVPEKRLGSVSLDQRVPVRVDSYPGETFPGRITFISRQAEFTPRNVQTTEERSKQVFRIKVTLEGPLDRLRVGMPADVLLDAARHEG